MVSADLPVAPGAPLPLQEALEGWACRPTDVQFYMDAALPGVGAALGVRPGSSGSGWSRELLEAAVAAGQVEVRPGLAGAALRQYFDRSALPAEGSRRALQPVVYTHSFLCPAHHTAVIAPPAAILVQLGKERSGRHGQWLRLGPGAAVPPPERLAKLLEYAEAWRQRASAAAAHQQSNKKAKAGGKKKRKRQEEAAAAAAAAGAPQDGEEPAGEQPVAGQEAGPPAPLPTAAEMEAMRQDVLVHCLAQLQVRCAVLAAFAAARCACFGAPLWCGFQHSHPGAYSSLCKLLVWRCRVGGSRRCGSCEVLS